MTAPKPYKVVTTDPGEADVVDRASGRKLGHVEVDLEGWWRAYPSGFTACIPGDRHGRYFVTRAGAAAGLHAWMTS